MVMGYSETNTPRIHAGLTHVFAILIFRLGMWLGIGLGLFWGAGIRTCSYLKDLGCHYFRGFTEITTKCTCICITATVCL